MISNDVIIDALYSATSAEPRGVIRNDHNGRPLREWHTVDPLRYKKLQTVKREIMAFLREMPADECVSDILECLETLDSRMVG